MCLTRIVTAVAISPPIPPAMKPTMVIIASGIIAFIPIAITAISMILTALLVPPAKNEIALVLKWQKGVSWHCPFQNVPSDELCSLD
jgi:hypothetical protein